MKRTVTLMLALVASTAAFRPFSDIQDTVTIKGKDGKPLRINASEYDKKTHGEPMTDDQVAAANTAPAAAAETSEPAPLPNGASSLPTSPPAPVAGTIPPVPAPTTATEAFVSKKGKKWVIADKDGNSIAGTEEYDSEAAANEAYDKLKASTGTTTPPPPPAAA